MIDVAINGYGTIGKRVADAVGAQPDMTVAGVAKTRPNFEAAGALERGFALYAGGDEGTAPFEAAGMPVTGEVEELVAASDIVVDATPSGIGAEYRDLYEAHDTPAIFQGGEDAELGDVSFNARSNYEAAVGADAVRVVSCNTTGLCRLATPLLEAYGIDRMRVTLVRRGGDPAQHTRGPINDILPNPIPTPSHHGPDVKTVIPELTIDTQGLKVPATLMHVHAVNATLETEPSVESVREYLGDEPRIWTIDPSSGIESCGAIKEFAADRGRPRADLWENCLWADSIAVRDGEFYCFQAIHQEADVVPENVDAIRAVLDTMDASESRSRTDQTLGVGLTSRT